MVYGAIGAGVGAAVAVPLTPLLTSIGIGGGFLGGGITGFVSGGLSGFLTGGFMTSLPGGSGDFWNGASNGAIMGAVGGTFIGGISGGLKSVFKGKSFFTGRDLTPKVSSPKPTVNTISSVKSKSIHDVAPKNNLSNQKLEFNSTGNSKPVAGKYKRILDGRIENPIPRIEPVATKGGNVLKVLGRGSTGRTTAANLTEQLAMKEILSNPRAGKVIMTGLKDARWSGWNKMQYIHRGFNGNKTVIHYVGKFENGVLKYVDDFKFK